MQLQVLIVLVNLCSNKMHCSNGGGILSCTRHVLLFHLEDDDKKREKNIRNIAKETEILSPFSQK